MGVATSGGSPKSSIGNGHRNSEATCQVKINFQFQGFVCKKGDTSGIGIHRGSTFSESSGSLRRWRFLKSWGIPHTPRVSKLKRSSKTWMIRGYPPGKPVVFVHPPMQFSNTHSFWSPNILVHEHKKGLIYVNIPPWNPELYILEPLGMVWATANCHLFG